MTPAFRPLLVLFALTLVAGSADAAKKPAAKPTANAPSACTDFYGNVNASWLRAHPLPAGADGFSRWDEIKALADRQSRELTQAGKSTGSGPASSLLADFVASGQDETEIDADSRKLLAPLLAQVDAIKKPKDLARTLIVLQASGIPVLYDIDVLRDPQNGQPRATLIPNGLGLSDPAFYTSGDPAVQRVAGLYRAYVADLLKFSGVPGAQLAEQSSQAIAIEVQLAQTLAVPNAAAQSVAAANKSYPQLLLAESLKAMNVPASEITFQYPAYFKAVDGMIAKTPVTQWQAYLRAQILHSLAPALATDFRRSYALMVDDGLAKRVPRTQAERVSQLVNDEAADLLSAAYAERYLGAAQEQKADAIGDAIRAATGRAIDRATWLDADAKLAARKQIDAMRLAIAKPATPVSFDGLHFDRGEFAGNLLALRRWQKARAIARLTAPVWPWPVSQAQPVVGFEPAQNRLIVTAAALQAPIFEGKTTASDYGAIGALMAQQIVLGLFGGGEYQAAWMAHGSALVNQYGAYTAIGSNKVDGARTQAQNAADLAGLEIAYDALNTQAPTDWAAKKAFYTAWAAIWARQDRDSAVTAALSSTTYAPAKWRVNGTVINQPDFARVFACKAGQPLFKAAKDQAALLR